MPKNTQITVLHETVRVQKIAKEDFISLTDIARYKSPDAPADVIKNWLRSRSTIELLGLWEKL
ncbi:MAG: KilA-N domain-containing protein, partial [Desulfuromonadaceae bacterium]